MSSLSRVSVFRIEHLEKHPNADALDIIDAFGCPVIARRGEYQLGDLACYIPVDMICPNTEEFAFLGDKKRVRAKRLRGVFSMGLLCHPKDDHKEGDDVTEEFGFTKYEPEIESERGPSRPGCNLGKSEAVAGPSSGIKYTDVDSLRRYKNIFEIGEQVIITEKIHGANARFVFDSRPGEEPRLFIGSHHRWLSADTQNIWTRIAASFELTKKLSVHPGHCVFGEVYGQVQDLKYGMDKGEIDFRVFDIFSVGLGRYVDYCVLEHMCRELKLPMAPELYRGPWQGYEIHEALAEGQSTIANNVREGFVVRPATERFDRRVGRVILKLHGQGYLLRK